MKKLIGSVFILCFTFNALSQLNVRDSVVGKMALIGMQYTANIPLGDFKDRYGYINGIGGVVNYKTKHNWIFGIEGNFLFGNKVKDDTLIDFLKDNHGKITNVDGSPAVVVLTMHGFNINAHFGKIFPIFGPNPNSGLYLSFGIGYLLHKINIESNYHVVPLVEKDMRRHFDYLTTGINIDQFVGYSHIGNKGIVSFYTGIYAMEGFTKNARGYAYDTGLPLSSKIRSDITIGLRFGWYIPIYKRKANSYYFY
jgi:hypothetical protein